VNTRMNFRDTLSVGNLLLAEDLLASAGVLCLMELDYLTKLPVADSSAG
jgi:hypothetical protein